MGHNGHTMEYEPYAHLTLQRYMLRDTVRNEAYREALLRAIKPGDTVLDMGAGTGILSLFSVQAGAGRVFAVERTDMAKVAERIVRDNGAEEVIEVIQSNMEDADLPLQVDVIVSEWMGGLGVDENMLAPLVIARDRYLKPGGRIIPERVTAWLAPAWDEQLAAELALFRDFPNGIDMNAVLEGVTQELLLGRFHVGVDDLLADPAEMWTADAHAATLAQADQRFEATLELTASRAGTLNGLATWFDADMGEGGRLTNAAGHSETHWGRYVFPLDGPIEVAPGDAISVTFRSDPAGEGQCRFHWSVQVNDGPREEHDTYPSQKRVRD